MIDVSDGLSVDVAHLCEESGVGAMILADRLPMERAMEILPHEKPRCKRRYMVARTTSCCSRQE